MDRVRAVLAALALALAVAACGSTSPTASPALPTPPGTPVPSSATSASAPSRLPPPSAPLLAGRLDCDGPRPSLSPDARGSALFDHVEDLAIESAFAHFLDLEGGAVGMLPVGGWQVAERGPGWATFEHVVDDQTKAVAFLSASPDAGETRWTWAVAACDAAEFEAAVAVTGGAVLWTDASGARLPFGQVGERSICGGPPTFLLVDGHAYSLRGGYPRERLLGSFAGDVAVPADARPTGYRNGDRRLWLAADGRAAYVGTRDHAQRLPRIRHDDTSVTDCN